jgi:hypothetical protein
MNLVKVFNMLVVLPKKFDFANFVFRIVIWITSPENDILRV